MPAIIKNVVNEQELPIISGAMVFTDSDRISVALNTSLNTPLSVGIDPVGLALHSPQAEGDARNSPFITVQMPEQHVKGKTKVEIPSQTAMIQDNSQLVSWFDDFFSSETTELRVKADKLVAHLGALKYEVGLDKTIRVQGLNSLKGFGVGNISFVIPANPDTGVNMKGTLLVPNAGVLTLSMGNVTFNMLCGNLSLGTVTAYDLTLKPGNNTPAFEGELYLDQLIPNLGYILDAQAGPLQNGVIELNATGNSTFYNGKRISYIETVLNNEKLSIQLPAVTLITDLLSGVLSSGSDGSEGNLLDSVGQVIGNTTLIERMLGHFDEDSGSGSGESSDDTTPAEKTKRTSGTSAANSNVRSMRTNLFRLGLRRFKVRK